MPPEVPCILMAAIMSIPSTVKSSTQLWITRISRKLGPEHSNLRLLKDFAGGALWSIDTG